MNKHHTYRVKKDTDVQWKESVKDKGHTQISISKDLKVSCHNATLKQILLKTFKQLIFGSKKIR